MFRRRIVIVVLAVVAPTAAAFAGASSGDTNAPRTIGLITQNGAEGYFGRVEFGGRLAATALGYRLAISRADDPDTQITTIRAMVARHVAAIAIHTDPKSVKQVLPALKRARAAGIPTLSYENRAPGSLWVNQTAPTEFSKALADALASQMNQQGEFMIVACLRSAGAYPIVTTWLNLTKTYIEQRYPQMQRVGVAYGDVGNGDVDTHLFNRLIAAHPQLHGLIFLCPGEAYNQPPLLVQANKVGQVFTVGNGGDCPPADEPYLTSVRLGAEELVCPGDPEKFGYLTVWAAVQLAHRRTFVPTTYDVGGPVGTVRYYRHNRELRLGQLLTITKANIDQYAGAPCPPGTTWPC